MVINYRELNDSLLIITYALPSKEALFHKINNNNVFNKFYLQSGLWLIQIKPSNIYKTGFVVPHG